MTLLADWSSSAPAAAEVSNVAESAGRIRTRAPGASTIAASYGGKVASTELAIAADSVISCSSSRSRPPAGRRDAPAPRHRAARGWNLRDVTALATWSSDSTAVTVGANGVATMVAGGLATVSASYGGAVGLAALAVTGDAPTALLLDATAITLGLGDYTWPPPTVSLRYADGSSYDVSNVAQITIADLAIGVVGESRWATRPSPPSASARRRWRRATRG